MSLLPTPSQNNVVIQNNTTGVVDYLNYNGSTLVASNAVDYGLGADFKIVANDKGQLVAQNDKTGFVDFLTIGTGGKLLSSVMSSIPLPKIFGYSEDTGEFGSQLANGEIDMLQINQTTGALTGSSLVAGTTGLAKAVSISSYASTPPAWNGVPSPSLQGDVIDTQLANGQIDILGLSGTFGAQSLSSSYLVASSVGMPTIGEFNTNSVDVGYNYQNGNGNPQGMEATMMTAAGQIDLAFWAVGTPDTADTGMLYASDLLTGSYAGWSVVGGGAIAANYVYP